MSNVYGWSYASTMQKKGKHAVPAKKNRYRRKSGPVNQRMHQQQMAEPDMPLLNKPGRMIVAAVLIVISVAVVVKEPRLQSIVVKQIASWTAGFGQDKAVKDKSETRAESKKNAEPAVLMSEEIKQTIVQAPPMALISDHGLFMLDSNGRVWPLSRSQAIGNLPVITGIVVKEMPGKMGIVLKSNVDTGLVTSILKQPFGTQLSECHFFKHGLVLYTRDGIKVKMQITKRFKQDLIRLDAVLEDIRIKNKQIAMIDMRFAKHIVVRPARRR